jgi:regulator of CtrA degradation
MSVEEAMKEKHRINLAEIGKGHDLKGAEQMPDGLKSLSERSLRLLQRVKTLDSMLNRTAVNNDEDTESPINAQLSQLARAFRMG